MAQKGAQKYFCMLACQRISIKFNLNSAPPCAVCMCKHRQTKLAPNCWFLHHMVVNGDTVAQSECFSGFFDPLTSLYLGLLVICWLISTGLLSCVVVKYSFSSSSTVKVGYPNQEPVHPEIYNLFLGSQNYNQWFKKRL